MSSELAVQDTNVVALHSPMDMPVEQFKSGLEQRETNRQALLQWISKNLKEEVDYGIIRNKKSLWKPGAEKISGMLGIKREYPNMDQYQLSASEGKELTNIIIKCVLLNSAGIHVSEGLGARTLRQDGGDLNKCIKIRLDDGKPFFNNRVWHLRFIFFQKLPIRRYIFHRPVARCGRC